MLYCFVSVLIIYTLKLVTSSYTKGYTITKTNNLFFTSLYSRYMRFSVPYVLASFRANRYQKSRTYYIK